MPPAPVKAVIPPVQVIPPVLPKTIIPVPQLPRATDPSAGAAGGASRVGGSAGVAAAAPRAAWHRSHRGHGAHGARRPRTTTRRRRAWRCLPPAVAGGSPRSRGSGARHRARARASCSGVVVARRRSAAAPKEDAVDERKAEKGAKDLVAEIYESIGHGDTDGLMSLLADPLIVFGPRRTDAMGTRADALVALKAQIDVRRRRRSRSCARARSRSSRRRAVTRRGRSTCSTSAASR